MQIDKLTWTQIPNCILDGMAELSDCELRVLLAILRKTIGYHKEADRISHSQLQKITGLSVHGIKTARDGLVEKGLITYEVTGKGRGQQTWYDLKMSEKNISHGDTISEDIISHGDTKEPVIVSCGDITKESNIKKEYKENTPAAESEPTIVSQPKLHPYLIELCDEINHIPRETQKFKREMKAAKYIISCTQDILFHYGGQDIYAALRWIVKIAQDMKKDGHWYMKARPVLPSTIEYCYDEIIQRIRYEKKRREDAEAYSAEYEQLKRPSQ